MGLRTILSLKLVLPMLAVVIGTGWLGGGVTWTPREAEAAPPRDPSNFRVTAYNAATNQIRFTWADTENYPNNDTCDRNNSRYSNTGWFVGNTKIASGESSRTGSTTAIAVDGRETFTLRYRWRDEYYTGLEQDDDPPEGCRYQYSDYSSSTSYTFPAKTTITSATYDRSTGELSLAWTGTDHAYWDYAIDLGSRHGMNDDTNITGDLASGDSARAGTATVDFYAGNTYSVWVVGLAAQADDPVASHSTRIGYSAGFEIAVPADTDCTESDAIDAGILGGSSHDVTGNFDVGRCALDPDDTDNQYGDPDKTEGLVYSFTISSARTTSITFNPTTSFEDTNPTGQYRVRVRSGSLEGTELGVQTGSGAMTIGPLDIGAGTTYYIEVMRFGFGGGKEFSLGFTYPYIERPTPTPIPTQTPRPQPNVDFRLEPNPNQLDYAEGRTYSFGFLGRASKFPIRVRAGNSEALAVGRSSGLSCSSNPSADDEVELNSANATLYVRTCADSAGKNSTLAVMTTTDFELLAEYSIYVAPSILPTPAPVSAPGSWEEDREPRDGFGISIMVRAVCGGFGVGCDDQLVKNGVWFLVATFGACVPVLGLRGPASPLGMALGVVVFILTLMVGTITSGFPVWLTGLCILVLFLLAGMGVYTKMRKVRA